MTHTTAVELIPTQQLSPKRHVNRLAVAVAVAAIPAWSFSFFDQARGLPFAAITMVAVITVIITLEASSFTGLRTRPAMLMALIAVLIGAAVSLAATPSVEGSLLVVPMAGSVGVAIAIAGFTTGELSRFVALPLLATTALQSVFVAIQAATGEPTVLQWLSPDVAELFTNGGVGRAQGLYDHSYEAAAVAVVAIALGFALMPAEGRMSGALLVGMGAAATTVALTHSRSAVLGLAFTLAVATIATLRGALAGRTGLAVVAIAFIIPAIVTAGGWMMRVDQTLTTDLDSATLGRVGLTKQGIEVIRDNPVFGVGPNGYLPALEEKYNEPGRLFGQVHNQSLQVAAELGVATGIAFTVLLTWAGVQAVRGGYRPIILFVAPLPFVLFDVLLYVKLIGLLLVAAWAGALAVFHAGRVRPLE